MLGLAATAISLASPEGITGPLTWRPVFAGTILLAIGVNALLFGVIAKLYGVSHGLVRADRWADLYRRWFRLEALLVLAAVLFLAGLVLELLLFGAWTTSAVAVDGLALAALAQTLMIVGAELGLAGFLVVTVDSPSTGRPGHPGQRGRSSVRIALVYDAIYPWVAGGAERRFNEIGRRLAERHEVHMVGWKWWDGPATVERDGMMLHGLGRARRCTERTASGRCERRSPSPRGCCRSCCATGST